MANQYCMPSRIFEHWEFCHLTSYHYHLPNFQNFPCPHCPLCRKPLELLRLSVTPEPYESAPTPEDFSLEEI